MLPLQLLKVPRTRTFQMFQMHKEMEFLEEQSLPEQCGLHCLPAAFHVADLTIMLGWGPKVALRNLHNWTLLRRVQRFSPQSDVYANLVHTKYPNWEPALRMTMPSAVIMGIEALRRAGWITQIPYLPTVVVDAVECVFDVEQFNVLALPTEWFQKMAPGIQGGETGSLKYVRPAWALADLIKREGWCDCGVGPDDIYWNDVTEQDRVDWEDACMAIGLKVPSMNPDEPLNER